MASSVNQNWLVETCAETGERPASKGASSKSLLRETIEAFQPISSEVLLHTCKGTATGPGGTWQPVFWFADSDRIRAGIVPLDGGEPVALASEWVDPAGAAQAAAFHAALAAEG